MKLGKTILCNIPYQQKIIQQCNVLKFKMRPFKLFDAKFHRNGETKYWYIYAESNYSFFSKSNNNIDIAKAVFIKSNMIFIEETAITVTVEIVIAF